MELLYTEPTIWLSFFIWLFIVFFWKVLMDGLKQMLIDRRERKLQQERAEDARRARIIEEEMMQHRSALDRLMAMRYGAIREGVRQRVKTTLPKEDIFDWRKEGF